MKINTSGAGAVPDIELARPEPPPEAPSIDLGADGPAARGEKETEQGPSLEQSVEREVVKGQFARKPTLGKSVEALLDAAAKGGAKGAPEAGAVSRPDAVPGDSTPVLVADAGETKARKVEYPVTQADIDNKIKKANRMIGDLPKWSDDDKRFFYQRPVAGNMLLLEPPLTYEYPSAAEIANQPMTRRFDAADRMARTQYVKATVMYQMASDYLQSGQKGVAQQCFDAGRALDLEAGRASMRNRQWLQLRSDHHGQAMEKHVEDMKAMSGAAISAVGADAYVLGKAFGGLTKLYGNLKTLYRMNKIEKTAEVLASTPMARLEEALANPERLSKMKPDELMELSGSLTFGGERGAALTFAEADAMIKLAASRPEFIIKQGEAITADVLKNLGRLNTEDSRELAMLLTNDGELARMKTGQLVMRAGGELSEREAKTIINAADLRLNKELDGATWHGAISRLEARIAAAKAAGRADPAAEQTLKEMTEFMQGLEAHQRLVALAGDKMTPVVGEMKKLTAPELANRYQLSVEEAEALAKDLKTMPDKINFHQHDLWGPAGKTDTSIARGLGRSGSPGEDPVVAYAHYRHNLQFGHHKPGDSLTRLEAALDRMDAMRDTLRSYRDFKAMPWNRGDVPKPPAGAGADAVKAYEKLTKTSIDEQVAWTKEPAERAWAKVARQEVEKMESGGEIPRAPAPSGTRPVFHTGEDARVHGPAEAPKPVTRPFSDSGKSIFTP